MRSPAPRFLFVAIAALAGVVSPMSASAESGSAEDAPAVAAPQAKPPAAPMTEDEAAPPDESEPGPSEPSPAAAPVPSPAAKSRPTDTTRGERREHLVVAGDTLGGIAHHYHVLSEALATANGITRTTPIRIGQKLVVPLP